MPISLVGMKVIYKERVYKGVAIQYYDIEGKSRKENEPICEKIKRMGIVAIDSDGQAMLLDDEGWMFQFLPEIKNG